MADSTGGPTDESPAQKQARLRRERRNAKLQAGGSDRLNKITSLSGRPAAAEAFATPSPSPSPAPIPRSSDSRPNPPRNDADPDEVDISTVFRQPAPQDPATMDQQALLQQLLRGGGPIGGGMPNGGFDGSGPDQQPPANDPMLQMMQQMMGGGPGMGGPPGPDGMPPGLASMFGQGFPAQQQQSPASSADYTWRIVHAVCALILAIYTASSLSFSSSSLARQLISETSAAPKLFWMFATAELVLQSTRYFVDGGKMPPGGLLATVAGFLPQPYAGYVQTLSRYSLIYTTILSDAMVIIFVLGTKAWLSGAAAA